MEGGKGDSWCCHALEERSEMEWMVLLCAGRWSEEGGFLVLNALEEGGEMECLGCYAHGRWREEGGCLVLLCARGREGDEMLGASMRWKMEGGRGMASAAPEEGSEIECLVLLRSGRRREEE
jgi:hypothetical protein